MRALHTTLLNSLLVVHSFCRGLQTIKVDHLYGSLESRNGSFDDPYLAHDFLGGIATGAAAHGACSTQVAGDRAAIQC